jgi:hypothetical protein
MRAKTLWILLSATVLASAMFAQEHHGETRSGDLGSANFPISCARGTEETFSRGVALLYSFEYEKAHQAFEHVALPLHRSDSSRQLRIPDQSNRAKLSYERWIESCRRTNVMTVSGP